MTSSKIRLGFISCGYITGAHLRGLKLLREHGYDNFEVTALCSRKAENAERWVERGKGPAPLPMISASPTDPLNVRDVWVRDFQSTTPRIYTDHRDMLRDQAVDAIVILSAVSMHYPVGSAALDAGVHTLIEKPFTITARAAQRLIEKANQHRLALGVAENQRYMDYNRARGWAIRENKIGPLQMVISGGVGNVWSPDQIVARTPWRHLKNEAGGGGTMDIGAHLFDTLRYQCGEIDEVNAITSTIEPTRYTRDEQGRVVDEVGCDADDTFFALLRFKSGAIGNLLFSWAGHGPNTGFEDGGAIYGQRGCLKGDQLFVDGSPAANVNDLFHAEAEPQMLERFFPQGIQDGFALELGEFLNAIAQGRQPETSGVEGLRDIAPCLAALESSALQRPVKLSDIEECRIETYQQEINTHWGIQ